LLARHGETEWNALGKLQGHTDIELNDAGRAQARSLAVSLAGSGITAITTSDLARARQTGEIVAAALQLAAPTIDPELRERQMGVFEGLTRKECEELHPQAWQEWVARTGVPHGGEPLADIVARMARVLARIASEPGGPVLVISHGGAMRLWLIGVLGTPVPLIANGMTYVVDHDADGVRVATWAANAS